MEVKLPHHSSRQSSLLARMTVSSDGEIPAQPIPEIMKLLAKPYKISRRKEQQALTPNNGEETPANPKEPTFQTAYGACSIGTSAEEALEDNELAKIHWHEEDLIEHNWSPSEHWNTEQWYPGFRKMLRWKKLLCEEQRFQNSHMRNLVPIWSSDYEEQGQIQETRNKKLEHIKVLDWLFCEDDEKKKEFEAKLDELDEKLQRQYSRQRSASHSSSSSSRSWVDISDKKRCAIVNWTVDVAKQVIGDGSGSASPRINKIEELWHMLESAQTKKEEAKKDDN